MISNIDKSLSPFHMSSPRLGLVGVGGCGGNLLAHLKQSGLFPGGAMLAVNTDGQALAQVPVDDRLLLGRKSNRGWSAGGDPEVGRRCAEDEFETIRRRMSDFDVVLVLAGMGGGTGSGAAPLVARAAHDAGALVMGIATLPFVFEGSLRRQNADCALVEFRQYSDVVICFPNQVSLELVDPEAPITHAFGRIHQLIADGLRAFWRSLGEPGLINIDFGALKNAFQDSRGMSVLATVEAKGSDRTEGIISLLESHPMLDQGKALSRADSMIVSVASGPEMTMVEMNRLMHLLKEKAPEASLMQGMTIDPSLAGRISVTVIANRDGGHGKGNNHLEQEESAPDRQDGEAAESVLPGTGRRRRSKGRFVPPPPDLPPEEALKLIQKRNTRRGIGTRMAEKMTQRQLPLEIVSRGRFEKSEPTIHHGENLDEPTYIRKGVVLN